MNVYTKVETIRGRLTCKAKLLISIFLVIMKVRRPAKIELMAATGPQDLKAGITPKSIGTAIGPTKAPNQVMIKPRIPPKYSY